MHLTIQLLNRIYSGSVTPELVGATSRKLLMAISKTKPRRWRENMFLAQMTAVYITSCASEEGKEFFKRLRDVMTVMRSTKPHRIAVGFDLMFNWNGVAQDTASVTGYINSLKPMFEQADDMEYYNQLLMAYNLIYCACGHVEHSMSAITVADYGEGTASLQVFCRSCVEGGNYVTDVDGYMIAPEFAVDCYFYNPHETSTVDRRRTDIYFDEEEGCYFRRGLSIDGSLIDQYHTSRRKGFRIIDSPWLRSHKRAFGCELEVQIARGDRHDAAKRVHHALNGRRLGTYCYFENDASIGDGFEIVTQPAGLDVHAEKFAAFLNNKEVKKGLRSHEGGACGFHVHVGRSYLGQTQIWRMQAFLNDPRNESLIRKVARRYNSSYCRVKYEMAKLSKNGKGQTERYDMLNVTNRDTVEFRMFRGSLRYESIMAALEFCNALCEFCLPGMTQYNEFNAIGFKKFILRNENKADTKFLRNYLGIGPVQETRNDNEHRVIGEAEEAS